MIVDGHIHVWSPDQGRYPFAPGFTPADAWLPAHTPQDHERACADLGEPVRVNLVQMTWYGLDHRYIADRIAEDPRSYVGTGVVPARSDVSLPAPDRAMVALARQGIRAFRIRGRGAQPAPDPGDDWLRADGYQRMFACAADEGLLLSFLTGPGDLAAIGAMSASHPRARVVIDHVGGVRLRDGVLDEAGMAQLLALADLPQVYVKLGPLHALGDGSPPFADVEPLLAAVVDAFGADRCLWESDAGGPILMDDARATVTASVGLIRGAGWLDDAQKDAILGRTALRLFWEDR